MVIKKTARITYIILTALMAVLAFMWLFKNFTVIADYRSVRDYLAAADTKVTDEFLDGFYTLILRFVLTHTSRLSTMAAILYGIQLIVVSVAAFLFARALSDDVWMVITTTVFIVANPFVLSTALCIGPQSLYFAILLLIIQLGVDATSLREKGISFGSWGRFVKWIAAVTAFLVLMVVSDKMATTGSYNRCEKTMLNYELQRFVWPHFGEINYTFYLEQTGYDTSDVSANYLSSEYMWEHFVPSIYEHYGNEAGKEVIERYVKEFGFKARTKENIVEWGKDIASYFFAPYTIFLNMKGKGFSKTGQIYDQFTKNALSSRIYWYYSLIVNLVVTLVGLVTVMARAIYKKISRKRDDSAFINKFTVCSLILVLVLSIYYSFFSFRGFNLTNGLYAIIIWPIIFVYALAEDMKKSR